MTETHEPDEPDEPDPASLPPAFFLTDGDRYLATPLARGPWDPSAAHAGPVAALIGREVERFDPDPDLATVRFTIELLRPVPLGPLHLSCTLLRPGKRVRLIGVSVLHDTVEVTRATVLRIRRAPEDVARARPTTDDPLRSPQRSHGRGLPRRYDVGIIDGLELRPARGSVLDPGPSACWFRVKAPLVDDEEVTPLTRALVAADFGNGIASVLSMETHLFINPDLTVHLHRLPEGEWVANDAVTSLEPAGAAFADATLADRSGPFGRAVQSLYVAGR